ncbi:endonuclease/exonuclease/phosphatase family protein [Deinococcus sp. KNUC1210]|uniref:endonuclease/exonuclease/phosphatase family protein n=1 Tax=Deinococcus sp. KNUC1210 TaxID=2917691 RepID=UPI001EF0DC6B|nr:endonuclease/exonuclease/phosphatase family protein [Deinococcus sp. KNUC1210]ULH16174.1 endonuclease/exonuclease/phosphatase family protein [Deinococcus sp. KNUC1210]
MPILVLGVWRRSAGAVLGGAVAGGLTVLLLGWQDPAIGSHAAPTLRLMTYNIARGAGGAEALGAAIRAQNPDVVCLQETNTLPAETLDPLLRGLPEYRAVRSREVVLLSRFPVLAQQQRPLTGSRRTLLSATLEVRGQRLNVIDAHFTTVPLRGGWLEARDARQQQLGALLSMATALPGALAVCGDFNTPPRGLIYAALKRTFGNAFEQAGTGFGYSFPSGFPVVRIDHVWLRGVRAVSAIVPDSRASDHRPLVVELVLPGSHPGRGPDRQ